MPAAIPKSHEIHSHFPVPAAKLPSNGMRHADNEVSLLGFTVDAPMRLTGHRGVHTSESLVSGCPHTQADVASGTLPNVNQVYLWSQEG